MDGDERRTPAVGERQREDVVALGLTVAREIGFALARRAVGDGPVGRPLEREAAIGRELAQSRFAPAAAEAFGHGAAEAADLPVGSGAGEQDDAVVDRAEAVEHQVFEARRRVDAGARHRPAPPELRRLLGDGRGRGRMGVVRGRHGHRVSAVRETATAEKARPAKKSLNCRRTR